MECLLGGKADVGHFLPEENTTIQGSTKHCGNVPKWELQRPSRAQTKGRASLEARPAEHRGRKSGSQSSGCPRPCFEVMFLPTPRKSLMGGARLRVRATGNADRALLRHMHAHSQVSLRRLWPEWPGDHPTNGETQTRRAKNHVITTVISAEKLRAGEASSSRVT